MLVGSHPGYLAVLLLINSLTSWNTLAAEIYIFFFPVLSSTFLYFIYIFLMYLFISTEFPSGEMVAYNYIDTVLVAAIIPATKKFCHKMNEAHLLAKDWIDSW